MLGRAILAARETDPIWTRLARSAWSTLGAILVILIIGALGVVLIACAPLWQLAHPMADEVAGADEAALTAE
jgi:hypothetical protein